MFALQVVGFIRGRWIHSGSPWVSLVLLWFALLGCWVYPESLGSVGFALGVVGFIRVRRVHLRLPWGSLGSYGVVGFIRVRPGGRWVHVVSLGSLRFAMGVVGITRVRPWGQSLGSSGVVAFTRGSWVHLGSLGSLGFALVVVGFIRVRWVHSHSLCWSLCSSGVVSFTRVRPGGRWVHSCWPWGC